MKNVAIVSIMFCTCGLLFADIDESLLNAAAGGDTITVKALLSDDASIEAKDQNDRTPLILAAENGHSETVAFLIEAGAEIDARFTASVPAMPPLRDFTALTIVTISGHYDVAELLIRAGADPRALEGSANDSILRYAIHYGNTEILRLLLKYGVDANEVSYQGNTALMEALNKGYREIVYVLLEAGADVGAVADYGLAAVYFASWDEDLTRIMLEAGADPDAGNHPALVRAADELSIGAVRLLLEAGADINRVDSNMRTALVAACYEDADPDIVRLLIDSGSDLKRPDGAGRSALTWAVHVGRHDIVRILLDAGITPQGNDLVNASLTGDIPALKKALENGASLRYYGEPRYTPLFLAILSGELEAVRLLLEHGADPSLPSGDMVTWIFFPLERAAAVGSVEMVDALLGAGADPEQKLRGTPTALISAAGSGSIGVVERLLEAGARVNGSNRYGTTPLMAAASSRSHEIVETLIAAGANIHSKTNGGHTALWYAAESGDEKLVRTLIDLGADVNAGIQNFSATPLMAAVSTSRTRIVEVLLEAGARPSSDKSTGWTPLSMAARNLDEHIVRMLLAGGANPDERVKMMFQPWKSVITIAIDRAAVDEQIALNIVKLLRDYEVSFDNVTESGLPALHYAKARSARIANLIEEY